MDLHKSLKKLEDRFQRRVQGPETQTAWARKSLPLGVVIAGCVCLGSEACSLDGPADNTGQPMASMQDRDVALVRTPGT